MLETRQLSGVVSHAPGVYDQTDGRSFGEAVARAGWTILEVAEIRVDSLAQALAHPWFVAASKDDVSRYIVTTLDAATARVRDRASVYFKIFAVLSGS